MQIPIYVYKKKLTRWFLAIQTNFSINFQFEKLTKTKMTSLFLLFTIAIIGLPTIEGYPTPNPNSALSDVEKEIVNIRQHVFPGLQVAAKQLVSFT